MSFARRLSVFLAVTAVSIALDQVTKVIATDVLKGEPTRSYLGDIFRWTYATNDGAFLSLGSQLGESARFLLLVIGVGGLLLGISVYAVASRVLDAQQVAGYALIASGGISNWVDRVRFGGVVVDFMNVGIGPLRSGVFNIADLAIIAGIVVLFIHGWKEDRRKKLAASTSPAAN